VSGIEIQFDELLDLVCIYEIKETPEYIWESKRFPHLLRDLPVGISALILFELSRMALW